MFLASFVEELYKIAGVKKDVPVGVEDLPTSVQAAVLESPKRRLLRQLGFKKNAGITEQAKKDVHYTNEWVKGKSARDDHIRKAMGVKRFGNQKVIAREGRRLPATERVAKALLKKHAFMPDGSAFDDLFKQTFMENYYKRRAQNWQQQQQPPTGATQSVPTTAASVQGSDGQGASNPQMGQATGTT